MPSPVILEDFSPVSCHDRVLRGAIERPFHWLYIDADCQVTIHCQQKGTKPTKPGQPCTFQTNKQFANSSNFLPRH